MVSHLGNNAIGVASRASTVHVGGGVDGGGVGDDAVSIPSGTSTIVIDGNFLGGDDVGEGIHLSCYDVERVLENLETNRPLFIPRAPPRTRSRCIIDTGPSPLNSLPELGTTI